MGRNQKLKFRLKQAAKVVRSAPKVITNPQAVVSGLQEKVTSMATELMEVSQKASDGTKLGMIRQIQKKFPDAKPKCPNCGYHSTGYDDFIDHMRNQHNASI